ncbi:MAG: TonB-dependent receptor plug domain-containing protein [Candidatus Binatia bacterium]
MRTFSYVAAVVVLLGQVAMAVADEQAERPLGTVVVTATRTEAPLESVTNSISVVSEQAIENRQSQTVAEALRDVPGVDVAQPGSPGTAASVFIRGANADQSLILFDGVEVNSPTLGGFNFGNIMTDDIGRIEVLRGAGGTLYGSEAIGGVVNVISKKGEGAPHFSLASGGGNIGTSSQLVTAAGESGIVAYSASLGYVTSAGYRPINDDFSNLTNAVRIDVTPIEHGTLRGFWRFADSSLGLANNDIGAGLGKFLDPDARQHDEFYLTKIEWEHEAFENLTYRISGAYTRTLNLFTDQADSQERASPNFPGDAYFLVRSRVPSDMATGETQVNYAEGTVGISTVGFEFKEQSGRVKQVNLDGSSNRFAHSRSNFAGYVQQQLSLLEDKLIAVAGFRVDGNQDFGRELSSSWSVGYLQDWDGHGRWSTHIKGGYAEGFKAPTFNDLFYPNFGNPDLQPEVSSEYDGGLEQHLGSRWLSVEGTYFARRTKDLIQFAPVDPVLCPNSAATPATFLNPCNVRRADVSGVETVLSIGPFFGVSLHGTYSYLDFEMTQKEGFPPLSPALKTLERRPHNRMATMIDYSGNDLVRAADHFDANVNVVFVGERHDLDPFSFQDVNSQPAYPRADLALRYDMPMPGHTAYRIGWFARLQNLLDRNYEEVRGFKSPPINVLAGARLTF